MPEPQRLATQNRKFEQTGDSVKSLAATVMASESGPHIPGPADFFLPPIVGSGDWALTKVSLLVLLSVVIGFGFFYAASRKAAVVPSRLQFAGEYVYGMVRNSIARDIIGSKDYMRFVPYLFTVFIFIIINNFYGIIPFVQFPTMSHIGYTAALAVITWLIYNIVGIAKHGFVGYLKLQTVPSGVSGPILLMMVPLEFLSNIVVRPFTLAIRLFATMFAGHLLVALFSIGGAWLILDYAPAWQGVAAGVFAFLLGIFVSFLDMLIMFLQAYVFTLLSAMYIAGAVADEH